MNLLNQIKSQSSVFIIAELSANHNGSIELALETVRAAKRAGADAIKLQTYRPDTITLNVKNDYFKINGGTEWDGQYLFDLYGDAYTPWEWHKEIFDLAKDLGLVCFSSPFDESAVDFLETLNPPIYKIASFEITDIPLIKKVAKTGKPIIISTGIADNTDISLALDTCYQENNKKVALLLCTSAYPAKEEEANLNSIAFLQEKYGVVVGLSDHTLGVLCPAIAVSKGAKIIEKHIILDKSVGGPDAHFSLTEEAFKNMVDAVRSTEKMLGIDNFDKNDKKLKRRDFSKSIFISAKVSKGDLVSSLNTKVVRPGFGLHPKYWLDIQGRAFKEDFDAGTPLSFEMLV